MFELLLRVFLLLTDDPSLTGAPDVEPQSGGFIIHDG